MRESLYEQLKKKEVSFIIEFKKIYNLVISSSDASYFFSTSFKNSKFKVFYEDFNIALFNLFENDKNDYGNIRNLKELINYTININSNLTLNSFLNYLEFFKTLLNFSSRFYDINASQIGSIIDLDCDKIGYKFKYDEGLYSVMLKNPEAESVAIRVSETTREKIYKYLLIRFGSVEKKRECIKSLADDVENICKKYSSISEYSKLKQFIQCVRHTKDSPKKEFPFYYVDEEVWLDKIFEMIIGILSFTKTKEIVSEIISLEKNN